MEALSATHVYAPAGDDAIKIVKAGDRGVHTCGQVRFVDVVHREDDASPPRTGICSNSGIEFPDRSVSHSHIDDHRLLNSYVLRYNLISPVPCVLATQLVLALASAPGGVDSASPGVLHGGDLWACGTVPAPRQAPCGERCCLVQRGPTSRP